MTDAEIIKQLENKVRGSDWGGFDDLDLFELITAEQKLKEMRGGNDA